MAIGLIGSIDRPLGAKRPESAGLGSLHFAARHADPELNALESRCCR